MLSFSLPNNIKNRNMQYMRTFLVFIPTFFLSVQVFASPAGWHRLIYKGDTLCIYEHPLQQLANFNSFNDNIGYRNEKFGYELLNRQELEFRFEKGKLIETNFYDNSKSKRSAYCLDREKLMQYIYSNIKWEILPKQDRAFVVALKFSANEEGVIDEAEVKRDYLEILYDTAERRGYYELYDTEAIRVIKSIPEWDVYFSRGKFERMHYYFTIVFSEEYRLKYKEK